LTLLDAYALLELLADEPAAAEVEALLYGGGAGVLVVNLAEAIDVTPRVHRIPEDDLRSALEPLLGTALAVVVEDAGAGWRAAAIRRRHYDRRSCALSLAYCLLLAGVGEHDAVATADPAVCEVARREDLGVLSLPDVTGARP
jgi:PIN domain nuclease of toxin-antitoxin system